MSQSVQSARRRLAYLRVSLGFFAIIALTGCRVDSVVTLDIGQTGSGVLTVSMTADKDVVDQTPSGNFTTANWVDVFVFIILRRFAIAADFDAPRDLSRSRKPKLRPEQLLRPVRQSRHLADKSR